MKVKELIEELEKLDQDLDVVLPGYEGGFNYIKNTPFEITLALNYHKPDEWWYGRHERIDVPFPYQTEGFEQKQAILIC